MSSQDAKDAARYRFLRKMQAEIYYRRNGKNTDWEPVIDTRCSTTRCGSLDAAVDAAMAKEPEAALAAAQPGGGFVVVPVEPTPEMVSAALGHLYAHFAKDGARPFGQFVPGCTDAESEDLSQQWYGPDRLRNAYAAMLAAAPKQGESA